MKMTESRGWIWPKPTNLTCLNMTEMNEFDQKSKILLTMINIKLEWKCKLLRFLWLRTLGNVILTTNNVFSRKCWCFQKMLTFLCKMSTTNGHWWLGSWSTISLTSVHDVKTSITTSWKCPFRGHLIMTPYLGLFAIFEYRIWMLLKKQNFCRHWRLDFIKAQHFNSMSSTLMRLILQTDFKN